jgi:hypothetical protein
MRALAAITQGSEARNMALNADIGREESTKVYPELGHEPFNPGPEDLEDAWR